VDEPDRDGIQEVQLLAPTPPGRDQTRLLEHPQVLHDADARHRQRLLQRDERLPILLEQRVEQAPPSRICESPEHHVHDRP
jgi:hypothetical protein